MKVSFRSIVLPLAMIIGFTFHKYASSIYFLAPYLVFTMLFISYTAVDFKKLRITKLISLLLIAQAGFCLGWFFLVKLLGISALMGDSILVCLLTPIAASAVVVSCALGASRETVTTFTIVDNLMVSLLAPALFSAMGTTELSYFQEFWHILKRVAPQIVFPLFAALLTQRFTPKVNAFFVRYKGSTLYVWAFTLIVVLGKAFHDVVTAPNPQWNRVALVAAMSAVLCCILYIFGKWVGARQGEKMAGGQMLGQKNTSFGIWMAVEYLSPMAAVAPALYSVWQNCFNSVQMYIHDKNHEPET